MITIDEVAGLIVTINDTSRNLATKLTAAGEEIASLKEEIASLEQQLAKKKNTSVKE